MADHISEQELLKLIKELAQDSHDEGMEEAITLSDSFDVGDVGEAIDGFIKVEHGKIIVGNPSYGGNVPTIHAKYPVKILIDGQEIINPAKVSSESKIEWEIEEKPLFVIEISEDKLEAYLTINRTQRNAWGLQDSDSALNVTLAAVEEPEIIIETISLQDILTVVDNMGIKMSLNIAVIQAEIIHPSYAPIIIARGKAPVQGQDAVLDLFFSENIESSFTEVRGVVDFKNHMNIPSVRDGDVIAKKTPVVEGQPGYDVYGNILLPEPVNDIRISGKKHVEITSDFMVIARKEGRPRVTGNTIKYFDINTSFIVPGNVDLQTGNIVFAGDVIVYGDVMDNMIIESLGNIYVAGSVYNATLTATGSIAVHGNVIGGNLYSGYFGMLYNRLYHTGRQLQDIVEKIMDSANLLLNEIGKKNRQVSYGQVLMLLTESKYPKVWNYVKELLSVIASIQSYNKDALQQLKYYLNLSLRPVNIINRISPSKLKNFLRILHEAVMRVALSQESNVSISITQCQNSTLKSNGDIQIRNEGVIQSDLYSAGNIIFYLDNSVCRGSKLEAGDTISAMYVGGITGVNTSLKAANKVIVKKMFVGRVCVDRHCIDIFEPIEEKTFDKYSFK